jgi:dTDP-4-amino-4,6-dideoxygalactose transaminase
VKEFEKVFAGKMKAKHCVATASGTTALISSLGALDLGPGDEVILPPYTFVATFNVITAHYALPVFVDVDPATFQIDAKKIPAALTANTRVLMPVHIGGYVADLDAVTAIARERKLAVIEDACQAWFAEWKGKPVGNWGTAGCFSFQASKNLTSGEGGAVLTNDEEFATKVYNFHTPTGAKAGQTSGRGANFRLTEFQAALLLAQLTRVDEQFKTRETNAAHLTAELQKIPGIAPARFTDGATRSAYHLYMARYDKKQFAGLSRAKFLAALAQEGLPASGGYAPLNTSVHVKAIATNRHYQRIYGKDRMAQWLERNQCPVNDQLCEDAFWFPQTKLLGSRADMDRIAETIAKVQKRAGELAKV